MTITLECGCVFSKRYNVFMLFCPTHKGFCHAYPGGERHVHRWDKNELVFYCWYGVFI